MRRIRLLLVGALLAVAGAAACADPIVTNVILNNSGDYAIIRNGSPVTVVSGNSMATPAPVATVTPYVTQVNADSPTALYRLNDTSGSTVAVDSSSNANNGTYGSLAAHGLPPLTAQGTTGGAAFLTSWTGSSSAQTNNIHIPQAIGNSPTAGLSIEGLFVPSTRETNNADIWLFNGRTYSAPYDTWVLQQNSSQILQFCVATNVSGTATNACATAPDNTSITIGKLEDVVGTYDGAHVTLYVNGTQVAQTAATGVVMGYQADGMAIGNDSSGSSAHQWEGYVSDISVYPIALSSARVAAHAASALAGPASPADTTVPATVATYNQYWQQAFGTDGPQHMVGFSEFGNYVSGAPAANTYTGSTWQILQRYLGANTGATTQVNAGYNDRFNGGNGGPTVANLARSYGINVGNYTDPNRLCTPNFHQPGNGTLITTCSSANYTLSGTYAENTLAHTDSPGSSATRIYVSDPSDGHNTFTAMDTNPTGLAAAYDTAQGSSVINDDGNTPTTFSMMDNFFSRNNFFGGIYINGPASTNSGYAAVSNQAVPSYNYSDTAYFSGATSFINAVTTVKGFLNGVSDSRLATAIAAAGANALGGMCESCYINGAVGQTRMKEIQPYWGSEEQSELTLTNANKIFYLYVHAYGGLVSDDGWGYGLASTMLTYKHNYVGFQVDGDTPSLFQVFPGSQLVATQPVVAQNSLTTISQLQDTTTTGNGAYYREYNACYLYGHFVKKCVAVVNPSTQFASPVPSVLVNYTKKLYVHYAIGNLPACTGGNTSHCGEPGYTGGIKELGEQGNMTFVAQNMDHYLPPQGWAIYAQ